MNRKKGLRQGAARKRSAALSAQSAPAHDISSIWKTLPTSFHHMEIPAGFRSSPERALRLESAENTVGTRLAFRGATAFFFAHRVGETFPPPESPRPPRRKT